MCATVAEQRPIAQPLAPSEQLATLRAYLEASAVLLTRTTRGLDRPLTPVNKRSLRSPTRREASFLRPTNGYAQPSTPSDRGAHMRMLVTNDDGIGVENLS